MCIRDRGHTHIHQSLNGMTTTSTLKPARVPARPVGDLRWAAAVSQAAEKDKKNDSTNSHAPTLGPSASSSAATSAVPSGANTPILSKQTLTPMAQKRTISTSSSQNIQPNHTEHSQGANANSQTLLSQLQVCPQAPEERKDLFLDDEFESDYSVEEPYEKVEEQYTPEELERRSEVREHLKQTLSDDLELLLLPGGVQDLIMSSLISKAELYESKTSKGKLRTISDCCRISRLDEIPATVNPPSPLDAFRSTSLWDTTRCGPVSYTHLDVYKRQE